MNIIKRVKNIVAAIMLLAALSLNAQGYKNPIIKGFHPDPSVCRVDSDYYLVTSSFEYFPGVPIYHSRDMVNWEQIGNVLSRRSQLELSKSGVSGGIYAPTIRYNDGVFYMITTNVSNKGNFFVYTTDPKGEWSEPVWLEQGGIDPSLYFEDGKCYMTSNPDDAIWLCEIDKKSGKRLSTSKKIWSGTGGRYPEAPHIFKKDGYYYLLIAEGGTEFGHKVTIARSKNIYGPYESNPGNPIVTHFRQIAQGNPIQGTGHADLVQAHDGSWWMVMLGFRVQSGAHHLLGRETFLAPVEWNSEGWPVVNGNGTVSLDMSNVKTLPQIKMGTSKDWDFNDDKLGVEWNYLRNPDFSKYSLTDRKGSLRIYPSSTSIDELGSPSFVGYRQQDINFQATTCMVVANPDETMRSGMTIYMNNSGHYDLYRQGNSLMLRYRLGLLSHVKNICQLNDSVLYLKVIGSDAKYNFLYSKDGTNYIKAGEMDTRFLSSETLGGFTGIYIALFAESDKNDLKLNGNVSSPEKRISKSYADFEWFKYMELVPELSPKMFSGNNNPLLDFHFTADPTAVEYNGRLYVYATNDHQQYQGVGKDGRNSYEKINSLVMMSTDDMVNWTYHGLIDVKSLAPWIIASWAPSITSKKEKDGKTHFYLYFSNSGEGTGVLTSTSPVGPWKSPLNKSLVDTSTPTLGNCPHPFDPGVVIDNNGIGWLSFGANEARIAKLGKDMISLDGPISVIKAPYHFEANELNFINDTYVYTYNTDWTPHKDCSLIENTKCTMAYMTSKTPLITDSWELKHDYFRNPGDHGMNYSNNHTHLHKYKGKWYLFYHSMTLQSSFNTDGGFRNVCVDEINVDENTPYIYETKPTMQGVNQIKSVNPYMLQQAETVAATQDIEFSPQGRAGNMIAKATKESGMIKVRGVEFDKKVNKFIALVSGKGVLKVKADSPQGDTLAEVMVDSSVEKQVTIPTKFVKGRHDLFFILDGKELAFDEWKFK